MSPETHSLAARMNVHGQSFLHRPHALWFVSQYSRSSFDQQETSCSGSTSRLSKSRISTSISLGTVSSQTSAIPPCTVTKAFLNGLIIILSMKPPLRARPCCMSKWPQPTNLSYSTRCQRSPSYEIRLVRLRNCCALLTWCFHLLPKCTPSITRSIESSQTSGCSC